MELEKTFTPLEKSRMRLNVKVAQKDVAQAYQETLQKYAKSLQVPGFRKGKAPANIIESKYGPELLSEASGKLINQAVEEAIEGEDRFHIPLPYSDTVISEEPAVNPKEDFSFAVEYDVFPNAQFANIEGFEVEVPGFSVDDSDVQEELEGIRRRNAIVVDKDDGALAETGDIVTLSYDSHEVGSDVEDADRHLEGFVITLGEESDIYGMDDIVPGMKKGETKEVEKAYPEDYEHRDVAGKTIRFKITVDEIKKEELPDLDDELAQDVSERFQTLDDLKNEIRKNFEDIVEQTVASIRNDALIEKIVEANSFELPQSMIQAELYRRWESLAARIGIPAERLEKMSAGSNRSKEDLFDTWRPDAERHLKAGIAIKALISQLEIEAPPEDIEKEIEKRAEEAEVSVDEMRKNCAEGLAREYLIDTVKERRLFERLLEKNTVKQSEKKSFGELPVNFRW